MAQPMDDASPSGVLPVQTHPSLTQHPQQSNQVQQVGAEVPELKYWIRGLLESILGLRVERWLIQDVTIQEALGSDYANGNIVLAVIKILNEFQTKSPIVDLDLAPSIPPLCSADGINGNGSPPQQALGGFGNGNHHHSPTSTLALQQRQPQHGPIRFPTNRHLPSNKKRVRADNTWQYGLNTP
jgi:hypothetical protein